MPLRNPVQSFKRSIYPLVIAGIERGVPPSWLGYRCVPRESVQEYFARHSDEDDEDAGIYESVHAEAIAANPLPCNFASRDELPNDRGWWGYSFRDVPSRTAGETFVTTLPQCRVVPYVDENEEFWPAILSRDNRSIELREIAFRNGHAKVLRSSPTALRVKRATWILERVYDNYSHWLTAHLPKLLLLKSKDALDDVYLPPKRSAMIDSSLRMLGLDPERFPTFDPMRPLEAEEITLIGTDRFRPELLRMVREAFCESASGEPHRRIFISRKGAARRRLINEDEVWAVLESAGFERILMEELDFSAQVALMQETDVLVAPHGAGLTNMIFCAPGTQVVEIANLGFPNPNFYALASAMGLSYWLLSADAIGDVHPLERDLRTEVSALRALMPRLL